MYSPTLLATLLGAALVLAPGSMFAQQASSTESITNSTTTALEWVVPPDISSSSATGSLELFSSSSTEPAQAVTSSTKDVTTSVSTTASTSSTEELTTSTEATLTETTTTNNILPSATSPPITSTIPSSSVPVLCLAIVAPAPFEGPEWIAVYGLTPSTSASFLRWSFADGQGSILKVNASTTLLWDEATQTMRVELRSARLNNDGDIVILKTPDAIAHDTFIYPETERGQRWARDGCDGSWERFPRLEATTPSSTSSSPIMPSSSVQSVIEQGPTIEHAPLPDAQAEEESVEIPASPSVATPPVNDAPVPVVFAQPPPAHLYDPPAVSTTLSKPTPKKATKSSRSTQRVVSKTTSSSDSISTTKSSARTTTSKTRNPSAKSNTKSSVKMTKVTTKKRSPSKTTPPSPSSMPILLEQPESFQGVRVRVSGRVASQPSFIAAHTFVIVNEDGRGLLVKGSGKQPSPAYGLWIDVTGTITWNDSGLSLKLGTTDRWQTHISSLNTTSTDPLPTRPVDLLAPSQEDAWSDVHIEGSVTTIKRASFDVDVGEATLHVRLASRLGYRAQRLKPGDTVSLSGLLDLRGEEPTLLPQTVEGIQILTRAPLPTPPEKTPVNQPWMPVGAAAGTLALSESWRRLKTYRKQKQETAAFQALLQTSKEK